MATTYTGQDGAITMGGTAVAELRSFSIDLTNNTVEKTVMGDDWKSHYTIQQEWSGSADIFYNQSSNVVSGISSITSGNSVAFIGYPAGSTAAYPKVSGNIIVTGLSIKTAMDGLVEASISFTGNGAMAVTSA
jgi:predicted secreted protein